MVSIYQIALRSFRAEGTLKAAEEMLPYVKECGFDTVYLCPMFETDADPDLSTWSPRQRGSFTNNPKNPYKMADYNRVDIEYGSNADLRRLIQTAHGLGLKVLLDLVYLHCGRNAVFLKEHPDWVELEDGCPKVGERWPFARINYQSEGVREYLWDNMVSLIRDFDADGFRCDVGDKVPLDFWAEGKRRIRAVKPEAMLLNEGKDPAYLEVFDLNYFAGLAAVKDVLRKGEDPAPVLKKWWPTAQEGKTIHYFENHDLASDSGLNRWDSKVEEAFTRLYLVMMYTLPGVPMLFNGNEFADTAEQNMFSNRFYGKRVGLDWAKLLLPRGRERRALVQRLNELRKTYPALQTGALDFAEAPSRCVCYRRGDLTVWLNFGEEAVPLPAGTVILGENYDTALNPNGFVIVK